MDYLKVAIKINYKNTEHIDVLIDYVLETFLVHSKIELTIERSPMLRVLLQNLSHLSTSPTREVRL